MKRFLFALVLAVTLLATAAAQTTPGPAVSIHEFADFTTSASKQAFNVYGTGNIYHQFTYTVEGTASVMSVVIEGSQNSGTSWSTLGTLTDTGGANASYSGSYNMFRVTPTWTASTGIILRMIYAGSPTVTAKSDGSGSDTEVAFWTGPSTLAGSSVFTFDGSSIFSEQGALTTTSAPFISHTATWNDAAVTFVDFFTNITDTLSNAASLLMDLQVGSTSKFKVTKGGAVTATGLITGAGVTSSAPVTITQGTITTSQPAISHTATWNDGAVTFVDDTRTITSTGSAAASELAHWVVGSTCVFCLRKDGSITNTGTYTNSGITITQGQFVGIASGGTVRYLNSGTGGSLAFSTSSTVNNTGASTIPVYLFSGPSITPNAGAANFDPMSLTYTINAGGAQSGTVTGLKVVATETALNSFTHNLMDLGTAGGTKYQVTNAGRTKPTLYGSQTNCADSAGAAACGAAPTGAFVMTAAGTTVTVSTTAVTANSRIFIQEDPSLATELGITCNTTVVRTYAVTTRTAATSFVVTASAAPAANDACLSYFIVN